MASPLCFCGAELAARIRIRIGGVGVARSLRSRGCEEVGSPCRACISPLDRVVMVEVGVRKRVAGPCWRHSPRV